MRRPCQNGGDEYTNDRLTREQHEQLTKFRGLLRRRQSVEEDVEGQQHQAEADCDTPQVSGASAPSSPERDDPDQKKYGRDRGDIEREYLNDERRSHVRAEQYGQGGNEGDEAACGKRRGHQAGSGAALQQRRYHNAGQERRKPIAKGDVEQVAEV